MAITRQAGAGMGLQTWGLSGNNNVRSIPAGSVEIVPAGQFYITTGPYSQIQALDPISGLWRQLSPFNSAVQFVNSDGVNVRIANLTGTAVGGYVTNVGSGYTSAPVVTASAGGSAWTAIVGGAINATVTITTAGAGYNYTPRLVISAPPVGGIQATATCTISGGAINAVTVVNQGAGYLTAPTIQVIADPRDALAATPGPTTTAVLTVNATLAGAQTITAVVCTNQGTVLTAVPTLTFTGGGGSSAAATVVMCFAATGFTVGAGGAAYGNAQPFGVITTGGIVAGSAGAVVNPYIANGMFTPRQANMSGVSTSGGAVTATGLVVNDPGLFQAVPSGLVLAGGSGLATTVAQVTITVGGVADTVTLQPF